MAHYNHNGCLDVVRNNKLFYIRRKGMKKNVNVMMEMELKKALDKDAKKNHRSVGKHINFIIDNYLKGVA